MVIGERVKKWRTDQGLNQRAAAEGAGISQAAWHAIETGNVKRIGLHVARHVVAYMGGVISLDDLDVDTELPQPPPEPVPKARRKPVRRRHRKAR